jgi:hypothetical protein
MLTINHLQIKGNHKNNIGYDLQAGGPRFEPVCAHPESQP